MSDTKLHALRDRFQKASFLDSAPIFTHIPRLLLQQAHMEVWDGDAKLLREFVSHLSIGVLVTIESAGATPAPRDFRSLEKVIMAFETLKQQGDFEALLLIIEEAIAEGLQRLEAIDCDKAVRLIKGLNRKGSGLVVRTYKELTAVLSHMQKVGRKELLALIGRSTKNLALLEHLREDARGGGAGDLLREEITNSIRMLELLAAVKRARQVA